VVGHVWRSNWHAPTRSCVHAEDLGALLAEEQNTVTLYACTHAQSHTHRRTRTHTHTQAHMHTHTHAHTHAHTHTPPHTHTHRDGRACHGHYRERRSQAAAAQGPAHPAARAQPQVRRVQHPLLRQGTAAVPNPKQQHPQQCLCSTWCVLNDSPSGQVFGLAVTQKVCAPGSASAECYPHV